MIAPLALLLVAAAPLSPPAAPAFQRVQLPQGPVEMWDLDQVRIGTDTAEAVMKALEPTHTLDAAIAVLKQHKVHYFRTRAVLLPDRLPDEIRATINALPEGEPFVLPETGFISISVILARRLPPGAVSYRPAAHPPFSASKA